MKKGITLMDGAVGTSLWAKAEANGIKKDPVWRYNIEHPELVAELTQEVKKVFHREFADGLYFGRPGTGQFTDTENSLSTTIKRHIGIVIDYFLKAGIAQVKVQDHAISVGDTIQIHGPTTGVLELEVDELRRDEDILQSAERGTWATFKAPRCRVGDKVFFVERRVPGGA